MAPTEVHRLVPEGNEGRSRWRRITPGSALVALAAVLVACVAARDAAVSVMAYRYPTIAIKLAPSNAKAIVRVFDRAISTGELRQSFSGWLAASKQALSADPLNAKALRLLAYATEMTPNGQSRARAIMRMSEKASRRDLLGQLWLIEDAVRREDIDGALQHYDRALSVHPSAGEQLIPVLVSASTDPDIQTALTPYLRKNRSWVAAFLSTAIDKSSDPVAVAKLFERYGGARVVPSHGELETKLLQRLVQSGNISEAYRFASAAGASPGPVGFSHASTEPRFRPLTWALYDGNDGEVSLVGEAALSISVRPESRIIAASRTIVVRAGPQVLTQSVILSDGAVAPLVTWKAYCRRAGGPMLFWTRDIPVSATRTVIKAPIEVPDGCSGVQIDIEVTGSDGSAESEVTIDHVDLAAR